MLQKMVTSFARVGGYIKPCLHLNEPCYLCCIIAKSLIRKSQNDENRWKEVSGYTRQTIRIGREES
jgi:hypothetical protein